MKASFVFYHFCPPQAENFEHFRIVSQLLYSIWSIVSDFFFRFLKISPILYLNILKSRNPYRYLVMVRYIPNLKKRWPHQFPSDSRSAVFLKTISFLVLTTLFQVYNEYRSGLCLSWRGFRSDGVWFSVWSLRHSIYFSNWSLCIWDHFWSSEYVSS